MTTSAETQPPTGQITNKERWPTTQAYLTEAFDWWRRANRNRDRDLTFVEFTTYLNGPQTLACLAGKLNQQVFNGGLGQWVDNRYIDAATLRELVRYVSLVYEHEVDLGGPNTNSTYRVVLLLRRVQDVGQDCSVWDNRLQTESQLQKFTAELRDLTRTYVEHGERFMDTVERYLVATYPRPVATPTPPDTLSHRDALREVLDALGALSNPSELNGWIGDDDLQRRILEAADRPEEAHG